MKHYLMPMSNTLGETMYQSVPAGTLEEYSPARNDLSFSARAEEQRHQVRHANIARSQAAYEISDEVGETTHSSHARRPDTLSATGLDSVLHQGSLSHHYNYFAGGQQVPTVLQPMWPPCLGLTSLNDSGPYGPYWPDGAFVPYRPAPLRDPRYHCQPQGSQMDGVVQLQLAHNGHGSWSQIGSDIDRMDFAEHLSEFTHHYHSSTSHLVPDADVSKGRERFPPNREPYPSQDHEANRLAYRVKPLPPSPQDVQADSRWGSCQRLSISGPPPAQQATSQESNRQITNARFKEKVLVWAHRIYLSLLASIHQSRRAGSHSQRTGERYAQPSIYPKAPRQLSLSSSALQGRALVGLNNVQRSVGLAHNGNDASCHQLSRQQHIIGTSSNPSKDLSRTFQPSSVHNGQSHQSLRPNGQYSSQVSPTTDHDHRDRPRSAMSPINREHEISPTAAAATAIELLHRLCQESDWEWTDGLLLGGCLAYGLGDYEKALKWYSKVLHCDPK